MKILNTKVLKGPNYWSNNHHKLIVIQLDLEAYEYYPSNQLPHFTDNLKCLMPSLYGHGCSFGIDGGFFQRLEEGTWLGHVIEHIALELQNLAGMDCGFGRTFGTNRVGVYHVIFCYELEAAGLYAAKVAIEIAETLAQGQAYLSLEEKIAHLRQLYGNSQLGPSTEAILKEVKARRIPYEFIDNSLLTLGYGCKQKRIWATLSSETNAIAVDIASNKEITKKWLANNCIPVPEGVAISLLSALDEAILKLNFPLTIKPINGNHGRGVTTNICSKENAILAFNLAQAIANEVIVEKFIPGLDYRFLVINYRVVAVAERTPAHVVGNGQDNIQQLIDKANADPKRGPAHENLLTAIAIDESTLAILAQNNLSLQSVLPQAKVLFLKDRANLSCGGTAADVTETVHPYNISLAERIARLIGLDVCGIDVVAKDISLPLDEATGAVIEVNAGPGLRMHLAPNQGSCRNVAASFLDMLYKDSQSARIPLVAVTGTNGKTTVVRLIAHLARIAKHKVGFTSTEGIYLNEELIHRGDCSGPLSAAIVLRDPSVEFAVLECARGGILRSGLGFDHCDISVITNITEDHLGLEDIHSLEELTAVKSVVARATTKEGYAILNADDDRVYSIKEELNCQIALFGLTESTRIQLHCEMGGLAAYVENDWIVIHHKQNKERVAHLHDVPLTFKGSANLMIKNVLPATLAAFISGFPLESLQQGLTHFYPSIKDTPGKMNIFRFNDVQVMVDYAHNEDAYHELKQFFNNIHCSKKVGIIAASGDRRAEDIQKLGSCSAEIFDEIIIRHNKDDRGRANQEITDLLLQGIYATNTACQTQVISEEFAAVRTVLSHATPNSFIYYSVDDVFDALAFMLEEQKQFKISTIL